VGQFKKIGAAASNNILLSNYQTIFILDPPTFFKAGDAAENEPFNFMTNRHPHTLNRGREG